MSNLETAQNAYDALTPSEQAVWLNRMLAAALQRFSYLGVIAFVYRMMIEDFNRSLKERDTASVPIFAAMLLHLSKLAKQLNDVFGVTHMTADLNRLVAMSGDERMDDIRAVMGLLEFEDDAEWPEELEDDGEYSH